MINLCQNIKLPETIDCCGDWVNKLVDELLKRRIELYEKFNPEYEFDKVELEWKDGIWTATPVYKHRQVQRDEDLKDKTDEFRSQNIV